jgi:two-component system CheB/CheR fusion protein
VQALDNAQWPTTMLADGIGGTPTLNDDACETLRTLIFSEKQIQTSDQRWFSVRIMPYRRLDNVIDGAVITFVDITATKQVEATLRKDADA